MAATKEAPPALLPEVEHSDLLTGGANAWDKAMRAALPEGVVPYKFTVSVHEQDQDGVEIPNHTANSSPDPHYFVAAPAVGETDWCVMSHDIAVPAAEPILVCKYPSNEGAAEHVERIREFEATGCSLEEAAIKKPLSTISVLDEWLRMLGGRLEHVKGKCTDADVASEIDMALQWVTTIGERVDHLRNQIENPVRVRGES